MDTERGVYPKYTVRRNDGRDVPGGDRENARYLVLDYANDPYAWIAAANYLVIIGHTHRRMAVDLADRLLAALPGLKRDVIKEKLLNELMLQVDVAGLVKKYADMRALLPPG